MPTIIFTQPVVWYRRGYERLEYPASPEPVEVDADCAEVSLAEGWATEPGKAEPAAPENKDAAPKRRTKA